MKSCITISLVEEARGGPFVLWDPLPESIRKAKAYGFDAVEIFAPSADAIDPRELKSLLDDYELKLAAVGTGAGWVKHRLHLALPDAEGRRQAKEFIKSIIDFGGPFGASAIIGSMQGRSGDGVDHQSALSYLADALEELGSEAKQYNIPLIYEPLNRYETDQVNRMEQALDLLSRLSTRNVTLLCDLFHMNIEEADIAQSLRAGGHHVGHIHFVDSNRHPVGRGHLEMSPIINALREINYQGYLSAEAFPLPDSDAAAEQTINAYRRFTTV